MNDLRQPEHRPTTMTGHNAHPIESLKACADGEMSGLRHWRVRRHVASCRSCREEIEALKGLRSEFERFPQPVPRPELRGRILASLPVAAPVRVARPAVRLNAAGLAFGGVVVLALLLVVGALSQILPHRRTASQIRVSVNSTGPQVTQPSLNVREIDTASAAPAVYVQHDPLSEEATKRTAHQLEEEARQSAQNAEGSASARRRDDPFGKGIAVDPIRLALSAPDITAATSKLRSTLQRLNGTVTFVYSTTNARVPFRDVAGSTSLPFVRETAQPGQLMLARIPAAQVTAFQHEMRQLSQEIRQAPTHVAAEPTSAALPTAHSPQLPAERVDNRNPRQLPVPHRTDPVDRTSAAVAPGVLTRTETTPTVGVTYLIWVRKSRE